MVLAGPDPADATSAPEPVPDYTAALTGDVRGTRVGVPRALLEQGVDPDVTRALTAALETLTAPSGATLVDVELPHARYAIPVYYLVSTAEGELEPRAVRRCAVRVSSTTEWNRREQRRHR